MKRVGKVASLIAAGLLAGCTTSMGDPEENENQNDEENKTKCVEATAHGLNSVSVTGYTPATGIKENDTNAKAGEDVAQFLGGRECIDDCYSWVCDTYTCDARTIQYDSDCCVPIGRPLVVDGVSRVAAVGENDDWA